MDGIYKELDQVTHGSEYRVKKSSLLIIPYPSCTPECLRDFKLYTHLEFNHRLIKSKLLRVEPRNLYCQSTSLSELFVETDMCLGISVISHSVCVIIRN